MWPSEFLPWARASPNPLESSGTESRDSVGRGVEWTPITLAVVSFGPSGDQNLKIPHRAPALLGFLAVCGTAAAETITVCSSGCDHASINAAIDAANDGDVIQLSAETYAEGAEINTLGKAITLRGAIDKSGAPETVLDGGTPVGGYDGHRVLVCRNGETETTVFENLVIQNGYAVGNFGGIGNGGGGMYNSATSPTVLNCVFRDNLAVYVGGGMFNDNGSTPTVVGCVFTGNTANTGGGVGNQKFQPDEDESDDGGDDLAESGPSLTDCVFEGNDSAYGGAIFTYTDVVLNGCTLSGNTAVYGGGGIYNGPFVYEADATPSLTGTIVCGNEIGQVSANYSDLGGNCVMQICEDCEFPAGIPCPADLDGNGVVNAADLGLLAMAWSTDGSSAGGGADLDGDGTVGASDLGLLVAAWGPCP